MPQESYETETIGDDGTFVQLHVFGFSSFFEEAKFSASEAPELSPPALARARLRRDTETEAEALEQLGRTLDHAGLEEGWLVMFDLRKELAWSEKLFVRELSHAGKQMRLLGC